MKNKKIISIFSILLIIILIGGFFGIKIAKEKQGRKIENNEYIPQEEISEDQERQTIVTLYFLSKETNKLSPEARLIDIKEIINDPYDKLVNLLIEGPKNEKQKRIIPENTKLLKSYLEGDKVVLDFSSNFLNFDKTNEKSKEYLIDSIVNTLTQLTEVNNIKILIDGNQNDEFKDIYSIKK